MMVNEQQQVYIDDYFKDEGKKIKNLVNGIIYGKFSGHMNRLGGFSQKDMDDFYSIANVVFVQCLEKYDPENKKTFGGYLSMSLYARIVDEYHARCRDKRRTDRFSISIDEPINDDDGLMLEEVIASDFDIESEIEGELGFLQKSNWGRYMDCLSDKQKDIVILLAQGYTPIEIRNYLHMTEREYASNMEFIKSPINTIHIVTIN